MNDECKRFASEKQFSETFSMHAQQHRLMGGEDGTRDRQSRLASGKITHAQPLRRRSDAPSWLEMIPVSTGELRDWLFLPFLSVLANKVTRNWQTMAEKEQQAKQLDSVTDVVQEQEVDATKAQQAMNALTTSKQAGPAASSIAVSREDVALIVSELEISEELAEKTLREAAVGLKEGESAVVAALRKLVLSA